MSSPLARLLDALNAALDELVGPRPGASLLIAFSGGPDSLALLAGLSRLAPGRRLSLHAFHLDHGLDDGSAARATDAAGLAAALAVPFHVVRRDVAGERKHGESREQAARRVRYAELETCRSAVGADWSLTAHHRDDQVETLLLRLLAGSAWPGLAGIAIRQGRVARPLLGVGRRELATALAALAAEARAPAPLRPVADPTNRDLAVPRNRLRHLLLPWLVEREPDAVDAAASLAAAAARARAALARRLAPALDPDGASLDWWRALPWPVRREALRLAADRGRGGPGLRASVWKEIERQTAASVGARRWRCDAGGEFRIEASAGRLHVAPRPDPPREFSYTLGVPGFVEIPEACGRLRVRPLAADDEALQRFPGDGMVITLRREPESAGWLVRNRRPGDRLRPAGAPGCRKLKELLIDRKIPAARRGLLPLLCRGAEIVWVPGVAVAEGWRARPGEPAWIAEWERT